ncbi:sigma-54-dependent transcriptional regulator, partial [Candidatus Riflebacteria bacterium]
ENPILIVDDEKHVLTSLKTILKTDGLNNVATYTDSREVLPFLAGNNVELLVLDLMMPHISGEEILQQVMEESPDMIVLILTAVQELETAINCMKLGAYDYLTKPIEKNRFLSIIKKILEFKELQRVSSSLKQGLFSRELQDPDAFSEIITKNPKMKSIFLYIEAIAKTPRPILITGETGVGKELIARAIHRVSGLKGEFVAINTAGLDDMVFSDTLFGHKRGAYTGADDRRPGMIEKASGGTLFLDEIGDLSQSSQVKLLRLLQEKQYFSLGSDVNKISNARILAATNQDLFELMQKNQFRKDLYFRLNTHKIVVPQLKERMSDIPLLLNHFLEAAAETFEKTKPFIPKELIDLLSIYSFPGNVRELESMVFEALGRHKRGTLSLTTFKDTIFTVDHVLKENEGDLLSTMKQDDKFSFKQMATNFDYQFPQIAEVENYLVEEAMRIAGGNQSLAAKMLGLSRSTLHKRLKKK